MKFKKKGRKGKNVIIPKNTKVIFIILYIVIIIISVYDNINQLKKEKNYKYYFCFCAMGKMENEYINEVIDYYKKLGVDKFYISDNNNINSEKFSDVLSKEIEQGIVEIYDAIGQKVGLIEMFHLLYKKYHSNCRWLSFFDLDEFLLIKTGNKTIQGYLSKKKFQKCDVVLINWLVYGDSGIVYYNRNKTVNERFNKPLYRYKTNKFVKSIIKGNIKFNPWPTTGSNHRPNRQLRTCNSKGDKAKTFNDVLKPPILEDVYIKHFITKSAEEFIYKTKRGHAKRYFKDYIGRRVKIFFKFNDVTEEKVRLFEKGFNRSFAEYLQKK